jgi:N-acetylmuramoyl-L-alanine amidase
MMKIIKNYLTKNPYSRSGRRLAECKGIIVHFTGVPSQRAQTVWNYFENCCPREKRHASYHYIIDQSGDIIQALPINEVGFHCGTNRKDPGSGRVYTDWARAQFGRFANDYKTNSPNNCTIGIGLCIDRQGNFTPETLKAAVELTAFLLSDKKLTVGDIGTHKKVVGWKDCPLLWVNNSNLFNQFVEQVRKVTA